MIPIVDQHRRHAWRHSELKETACLWRSLTFLPPQHLEMKILHTSDWHIGQTLHNIDRIDDHRHMLGCIRNVAVAEAPDLMIVSGDIFHTSQPSAAAQRLLADALVEIHNDVPEMKIVLTAGNHDSASRHETHAALWETAGICTIGYITPGDPDTNIIEIAGKGWLAAIPYVNERNMPEGYIQNVLDRIGERNAAGLPVIMSAHTTLRGSDFRGHEDTTDYYVGGIDYQELEDMGSGYDYLALGHIHHPQTLRGSHRRARYCGTPLAISFEETFRHSVSIVTIGRHGDTPEIKEIPLDERSPLINIPAAGCAPWEHCLEALENLESDVKGYIRLNVEISEPLPPGAFQQAETALKGKDSRLAYINSVRKKLSSTESQRMTLSEFKRQNPLDMFLRYCEDTGQDVADELKELFLEAQKAILSKD